MALSNDPVFVQTPKTAGISFAGSSQELEMDPGTVAPTTLLTAGSDGALVTHVVAVAETTMALEKIVLWIQPGGSGDYYVLKSGFFTAYTQAATDEQGKVILIDKETPAQAIRLAASDVLAISHHIDQQSMVLAEYTDF